MFGMGAGGYYRAEVPSAQGWKIWRYAGNRGETEIWGTCQIWIHASGKQRCSTWNTAEPEEGKNPWRDGNHVPRGTSATRPVERGIKLKPRASPRFARRPPRRAWTAAGQCPWPGRRAICRHSQWITRFQSNFGCRFIPSQAETFTVQAMLGVLIPDLHEQRSLALDLYKSLYYNSLHLF